MRSYVVNKYEDDLDVWEVILLTAGCCGGLLALVCVYWGISRPTASDRIQVYFSRKHQKRERRRSRTSSIGAGQQPLSSSLGHSLDRSMRSHGQKLTDCDPLPSAAAQHDQTESA